VTFRVWFRRNEKALEVFKFNQRKHPEETFWTYFGLARACTALGDKENAIKNWEIALRSVPRATEKRRFPRLKRPSNS